jgi:hypothetical protein
VPACSPIRAHQRTNTHPFPMWPAEIGVKDIKLTHLEEVRVCGHHRGGWRGGVSVSPLE